MIFNPLFLSENGNSQILAPKSNKLSNNKYLFSDIVKIVMNPSTDTKEVNGNHIIGSNIGITFNGDNIPSELKLKFITEIEKENSEKGLTEILPDEIASLIMNVDAQLNDEKVISYISQEPLKGELQGFITELIGKDTLENYLKENSGLLIKLEDKKSTVNLELVKEHGGKSKNDKVIVQTLVVPEKTKLFSILGHSINGAQSNPSIAESGGTSSNGHPLVEQNNSDTLSKPQMSVYSFNYNGKTIDLQANSINLNDSNAFKLSLLKSNTSQNLDNEIQKIELDKISFIPKDKKGSIIKSASGTEAQGKIPKLGEANQKGSDIKSSKAESEFNLNKITILKKQPLNENSLAKNDAKSNLTRLDFLKNNSENGKKLHVLSKDGLLRNIKYEKGIGTEKTNANSKNSSTSNETAKLEILQKNVKSELSADQKSKSKHVPNNSKYDQLKVLANDNAKNSGLSKSITGAVSGKNQTEISKVDLRKDAISDNNPLKVLSKVKADNQVNTDPKLKTDSSTPNVENKSFSNADNEKMTASEKNSSFDKGKIIEESKTVVREESKIIDKTLKDNTVKSDIKVTSKIDAEAFKNEDQIKIESQKVFDKRTITDVEMKDLGRNFQKTEKENDTTGQKVNHLSSEEKTKEGKNITAGEIKDESKISIKVRNNLKSVSDKVESENRISPDSQSDQKDTGSEDAGFDKSGNTLLKNSNNIHNNLSTKSTFDNTLNHAINKVESTISNNPVEKAPEVENHQDQKIVKSVEVIKEISHFISKQEKGTLSFDIKPESLGKMKITLDTADNAIKARIDVDNEHARQLIERNIGKLQQELASNGIQLSSLNISLGYSRQQKDGNQIKSNKNSHSESQGQVGETFETEEQNRTLGYNTYEYIA